MNMNNYLTMGILGITALYLFCGFIAGLWRGSKRSLLRLILIAMSAAGAYVFRTTVTDQVMGTPLIEGMTITEYLMTQLPEELAPMADLIVPIVVIIVGIICFIAFFLALKAATWLFFQLLLCFVHPARGHKHSFLGGLIGIVQGAVIAFLICAPLNGLLIEVSKFSDLEVEGEKVLDFGENVDFKDYSASKPAEIYSQYGGKLYTALSTTTDKNGKEVTLSVQLDAISAAATMATNVAALQNVDFSQGITPENIGEVKDLLRSLDETKENMSPEAKAALNDMIVTAIGSYAEELPIDLSSINFAEVEFEQEGELLEKVYSYSDAESIEDIDVAELVNDLSKSTLILPVVSSMDVAVDLDPAQQAEVEAAINNLPDTVDEETVNNLKALFNLLPAEESAQN